jgi:hypothetical protein
MRFFSELAKEIHQVSWTLFRIIVPAILIVKLLEEIGVVDQLGWILGPVMGWVGLPESMGLVWATSLLTNIYGGMLIFFQIQHTETMSVAQVTVISGMMLIAHALPVEGRIAQQAGVRLRITLLLRIGGGLLFGWILHLIYNQGGFLQTPNELLWQPPSIDNSWSGWFWAQGQNLLMIQLIIVVLLTTLKILKLLGVETLMAWLLRPLLGLLRISPEATRISIVGVTLGLSYGGGILIQEAKAGHVSKHDIFCSMALLALCHSLIEDTLLVMLLGAHVSGVLWLRLAFSLIVVAVLARLITRRNDRFWNLHLVNQNI